MYSKYHNKHASCDGIKFDSIKERDYYCELKLLKMGHVVKDFQRQVTFELQPKFTNYKGETVRAIKYIADFVVEYTDGHVEIVDVKGVKTKDYILKKKMFMYKYKDYIFVEV